MIQPMIASKRRVAQYVVLGFTVLSFIHMVAPRQGLRNGRSLAFEGAPIDERSICSGLRIHPSNHTAPEPYYKSANYGIRFEDGPYGQTNNNIIEIYNMLDVAMDSGGRAVLVLSGWSLELVQTFFPDKESWDQLERDYPITKDSPDLNLQMLDFPTEKAYYRKSEQLKERETWQVVFSRQRKFIHYLFSNLNSAPCYLLHELRGYLEGKFGDSRYIAIHVRNFESHKACVGFSGYQPEQCHMETDFITSVLKSTGAYGKLPIVLISDMQDHAKLRRMQKELENVVIPNWDFNATPSIFDDIVLAAASDYFVGNRGSTASRNMWLLRDAFGHHFSTNFVFIRKESDGSWTSVMPHHLYDWGNPL